MCAFTAWYAVVHNNLCSLNHVSILEYDHISSTRLDDTNHELLTTNPNAVIAYSNTLTNHYVFTKSTPWLEIALKKVYNIDLSKFILQYGKKFPVWPTTTNITMPVSVLINFVNWFEPMTHIFREYPLGAYVHERAFFIFCVINNIEILFANNIIFHEQKQSHGIYDIYGTFLHKHQTHYLHSNMKYEYDIVYNNALKQAITSLNL